MRSLRFLSGEYIFAWRGSLAEAGGEPVMRILLQANAAVSDVSLKARLTVWQVRTSMTCTARIGF